MSRKPVDGLVASIRQKLLNTAARTGDDANLIWSWYAFVRKIGVNQGPGLAVVLEHLKGFLLPVLHAAAGKVALPGRWEPIELWRG